MPARIGRRMVRQITFSPTFSGWQKMARRALQASLNPGEIIWQELDSDQPSLELADELEHEEDTTSGTAFRVPRSFPALARTASCHRDPHRWGLLYSVLWRLTHGERHLLDVLVDPQTHELRGMEKDVRRDVHKMRAFVRFREVRQEDDSWYVAWFEPAHHIVELNTPFFIDRFANMKWSILTPERCVHWDGSNVTYTGGVNRSDAPTVDQVESLWLKYYSNIFNPARVKTRAMQAEMPKRYWKNLPEAAVIPALLEKAPIRVDDMIARSRKKNSNASEFLAPPVPKERNLKALREAASGCTACPLYRNATQTVFGEGLRRARLVFVGEQPGDSEDLQGRPFVGPAGALLDRALAEAGIDRDEAYVTNAVKHFKWEPRGKKRLHKKPSDREVAACRPWLEAELATIHPAILVCLGGTAAKSIMGREVRVLSERGHFMESEFCAKTLITVHPSSLLRAPDEKAREQNYAEFLRDLRKVATALDGGRKP
ncbi:MAG TPA: UdgX family uracil-DNA binding protein [Chthoniobacteraceae bacterium]|nr:UdgX family uracil-DNA binding protein [Chthoniobacteraceae bacterium]